MIYRVPGFSCRPMNWLLPHPLPFLVASLSHSSTGEGDGVVEEPNNMTARMPVPL
jgi:hypothetical protein